jgi:hypothetical protein
VLTVSFDAKLTPFDVRVKSDVSMCAAHRPALRRYGVLAASCVVAGASPTMLRDAIAIADRTPDMLLTPLLLRPWSTPEHH